MKKDTQINHWNRLNSGYGPAFQVIDIDHDDYMAVIEPDRAFWSLVRKNSLADFFSGGELLDAYKEKADLFMEEMTTLRFNKLPQAVYFNPTDRCNLNCTYCYIPENMRQSGTEMTTDQLLTALENLKTYFTSTLPNGLRPQIIFHGAEPMLNFKSVAAGIEKYKDYFRFGLQTNGTLLDAESIDFLTGNNVGIGLSIDGHIKEIADRTRTTWDKQGVFSKVLEAMKTLKGYHGYNVICTVTSENLDALPDMVDFFHEYQVPVSMLNPVRCTREGARTVKPDDKDMSRAFIAALDRSYELYERTGRKLVIANFANMLTGILAPAARRMMCDISPCGGGRSFFAMSADGGLYPCSEFIGLPEFNGGNIFNKEIPKALKSAAFNMVTERKVEDIDPCNRCAIRNFCGSPCPAEAIEMNKSMQKTGAFCSYYEEIVRYALRTVADGREKAFLWDNWDRDTENTFDIML